MNLCIPIAGNQKPYEVTDWKSAAFYCLMDYSGKEVQLLSKDALEERIAAASSPDVMKELDIETILCKSISVMTQRIFSSCGVEVLYTEELIASEAFRQWKIGKQVETPLEFSLSSGCSSSCSSCSSGSCK